MDKIKKYASRLFAVVFSVGVLSVGAYVGAADASTTLATLMGSIVDTSVAFATTVITTYWPYVLVFGIVSALIALFARFAHLGVGRGR